MSHASKPKVHGGGARYVFGQHPDRGRLVAAVDPHARFLAGRVGESRLAAFVAPYPSEKAAREAIIAEGGAVDA
jgi:hypothetical protein